MASTVAFAGLMQGCASTASVTPNLAASAPAAISAKADAPVAIATAPAPASLAMAITASAPAAADRDAGPAEARVAVADQPAASQLARVEQRQRAASSATAAPAQAFASASVATAPARTFSLPATAGDAPNIFGSVALAVGQTPSSASWRRVAGAALPGLSGPWAQIENQARAMPSREKLRAVNAWVNHAITFTDDTRLYRVADHWATAAESLRSGQGDCEDYAIAKMQLLRALGVPGDHLYLVVARDLVRHADHALLAVRVDGRFWILDSATDTVLSADQVRDYRPILTYSENRAWMHGYRRAPAAPTVMMADAGGAPSPMGAAAP